MKKTLSFALCLMPVFTMSAYAVLSGDDILLPIFQQTKSECISTCLNTHCCTEGRTATKTTCPDGWTLSVGTCVRASTTTYSEEMHRYTTTNYSSCDATTETFEPWTCTNYNSSTATSTSAWTACCVLQSNGGCKAIILK